MFSRKLLLVPLLAGAVGIPYVFSDSGKSTIGNFFSEKSTGEAVSNGELLDINAIVEQNGIRENARPVGLNKVEMIDRHSISYAPALGDFRSVFRFNATPSWIRETWPRVSVTDSDNLTGFRVPYVSGPSRNDVVGSLTFYLDHRNVVQRIEFDGYTFDPNRILQFVVHDQGLTPDLYFGNNWYTRRSNKNHVVSALQIDHPSAIYSNPQKGGQIRIRMELNNAQGWNRISREMHERMSNVIQQRQNRTAI